MNDRVFILPILTGRKRNEAYPQLPMLDENWEGREALLKEAEPIVIEVGDLIAFCGAHLHGSALNQTGRTRFSTEVRTVHRLDFVADEGAPNVDAKAPCQTTSWFSGINDGKRLAAAPPP